MRELNETVISTTASATINSAAVPAQNLFAVSVQITSVGGTPGGAMKLQASNDITTGTQAPVNWSDIPSATVTVTATPGAFLIPKTEICYQWIRVVYTSTGSGTIQAVLKAQGA